VYDSTELNSPFYPAAVEGSSNEYIRKEDLISSGPIKPTTAGGNIINNHSSLK